MQILETQWRRLVNDIQSGCIDESIQLDTATPEELQNLLQPNPTRAEVLRTEFEQDLPLLHILTIAAESVMDLLVSVKDRIAAG